MSDAEAEAKARHDAANDAQRLGNAKYLAGRIAAAHDRAVRERPPGEPTREDMARMACAMGWIDTPTPLYSEAELAIVAEMYGLPRHSP